MENQTDLLKYDTLVKAMTKTSDKTNPKGLILLERIGKHIESLNDMGARELVHMLYGKWPHNPNTTEIYTGAKRAIQARYYERFYGHPMPQRVKDVDEKHTKILLLKDKPYVPKPKEKSKRPKKLNKKKNKKPAKKPKREKTIKPRTKFSIKISNMDLQQVIDWATQIGLEQEKIDKHKNKPIGLAKMNISNMIRSRLSKQNKIGDLLDLVDQ